MLCFGLRLLRQRANGGDTASSSLKFIIPFGLPLDEAEKTLRLKVGETYLTGYSSSILPIRALTFHFHTFSFLNFANNNGNYPRMTQTRAQPTGLPDGL